ncbi:MAG TPA: hypothetical protein VNW15_13405 [Rhizomicrobium sp.]|jgi:hypothetical protein|nr:hypothetical protein [Rhizomicrobium sp.]
MSGLENVFWACGFVMACILFYRFAIPALRRFDHDNVERIARQEQEKSDPEAHFRHALEVANEQVEAVQEIRTGPAVQYLFETVLYFSREEAEEARAERVGVIARRFYQELPAALAGARQRGRMSARERASQKWKRGKDGETMH